MRVFYSPPRWTPGFSTTGDGPGSFTTPLSSYTTSFVNLENPLREQTSGGVNRWLEGLADGLDWNNCKSVADGGSGTHLACGSAIVSSTDDCIACLNPAVFSFHAAQFVQATVLRVGGYSPPDSHEIELHLRRTITAHSSTGYETLWGHAGNMQIVKWNGALGDFTVLADLGTLASPVNGDVLRVEMTGNAITVKINGSTVGSTTDSSFTNGLPGLGFFPRTGASLASFGWSTWTGGEL